MITAFPLGLTLQVGLYADSGPVKLRSRFASNWGKTEVFAANRASWDLTQVKPWSHASVWSLSLAQTVMLGYDVRMEAGHRAPYGDLRRHRARFVSPFGERPLCRRSMRHGWWLTEPVNTNHAVKYAVTDTDPARSRFVSSWSLLSDHSLQAVANLPELVWQEQRLRLNQATLSCDEDSPVWIASIEIAELADFAAIGITDEISLTLGLETFRFIVDGKTLSRESMTGMRCEVTAVSPVALLDAPFAGTMAFHRSEATAARVAVDHPTRSPSSGKRHTTTGRAQHCRGHWRHHREQSRWQYYSPSPASGEHSAVWLGECGACVVRCRCAHGQQPDCTEPGLQPRHPCQ
jgi:hypothetical protein